MAADQEQLSGRTPEPEDEAGARAATAEVEGDELGAAPQEAVAPGDDVRPGPGVTGYEAEVEGGEEDAEVGEEAEDPPGVQVWERHEEAPFVEEASEGELLTIADRHFRSRLILGTGKYPDHPAMVESLRASGAEMVTVAVRRVDLDRSRGEGILLHLDPQEFFLLANTAGCHTADEAVRYARLARAAGFNEWLKLEVIGDEATLLPDVQATIEAARILTEEGFKVMAYTNDDLVAALRLEDAGCVAVMPLASPIGSGMGLVNPYFVREIKRRLDVPVIVDAGVGTASDACETMEQGVDGVLMNTAVAVARDPAVMAMAMRHAVEAGRLAFLAGRMASVEIAVPSSPTGGMLD